MPACPVFALQDMQALNALNLKHRTAGSEGQQWACRVLKQPVSQLEKPYAAISSDYGVSEWVGQSTTAR